MIFSGSIHSIRARADQQLTICLLGLFLLACQSSDNQAPAELLALEQSCDIASAGCVAANEHLSVKVKFDSGFGALKPFRLRLQLDQITPVKIDGIELVFSMQGMQMGLNKYRLIRETDRLWTATVTLPICTSGRSDWLADFELKSSDQKWTARIPFVLNPG